MNPDLVITLQAMGKMAINFAPFTFMIVTGMAVGTWKELRGKKVKKYIR